MRRRTPAALAALLVALSLLAVAGPAAARGPQSEHDRIVAHWTPERMKAAVPRDFVREASGRFVPKARPGGGGGSGAILGASWTKGGAILQRSGKVYFQMGGSGWVCSGTVVTDSRANESLVLTAGHCAIDETNRRVRRRTGSSSPTSTAHRPSPAAPRSMAAGPPRLWSSRAASRSRQLQRPGRQARLRLRGRRRRRQERRRVLTTLERRSVLLPARLQPAEPDASGGQGPEALRLRLPGGRQVQGQGPDLLCRRHHRGQPGRQRDLGHGLQHDRRLLRRPLARRLQRADRHEARSAP